MTNMKRSTRYGLVDIKRTDKTIEQVFKDVPFGTKMLYVGVASGVVCVLLVLVAFLVAIFGVSLFGGLIAIFGLGCIVSLGASEIYDEVIRDLINYGYYEEYWE